MTSLEELLAARIRRDGPIPFADFMRECLYHPVHGYYSKAESQRFADYYTSVDVHPIFGRLLARKFAEMWEQLERPKEFLLVEAGAGVGRLAGHILDFCEAKLPNFRAALRYVA
ncbi:MAG TPA: SAM-dependent methyltransferase, partial [Candidatus Acidoferrum sp.]